jgi:16S rRNA (uracil1498-N3)-methyltransferase
VSIRLFVDTPLVAHSELSLPAAAARHAQVLRVQPGVVLTLFDGQGSDWPATILAMGRSDVRVHVGEPLEVPRELPGHTTLALGMPANERMDMVVEKATELGVAALAPLHTERSVLRLLGERAERKRRHWQGIAQAACEQCGRAVVPSVWPVRSLTDWLRQAPPADQRLVLSLRADAQPLQAMVNGRGVGSLVFLSGPEGGLSSDEEDAARAQGYQPVALGPRVLRADTAPLVALAWLALQAPGQTRSQGTGALSRNAD